MNVRRLDTNPIITPDMDERMGHNINGPSLIRIPDWMPDPLGKYYLYFGHHRGTYIRLATSDHLEGPWRIHTPGVLDLEDSLFGHHIASPDIHVMDDSREIRMYFHGGGLPQPSPFGQRTRLATSADGIHFEVLEELLGAPYWRVFWWDGFWYTLEMPGVFRRSGNGISGWEEGPTLFTPDLRHPALRVEGNKLSVYYSNAGDRPERILHSTIHLTSDWMDWTAGESTTVLAPEAEYEGTDRPLEPSRRGAINEPVHQLRDPGIFEEDGKIYLLYSVAGERGIAISELTG